MVSRWKSLRNEAESMKLNNDIAKAMEPAILVGIINMKLRNQFDSLDKLVRYFDLNRKEIELKLSDAGFVYLADRHQFR